MVLYRYIFVLHFKWRMIVARGGKRKGSGRKPTGKVAMLVRVDPEVRSGLDREAKRNKQSLSAVAERYLAYGSRKAPSANPDTEALCHLIRSVGLFARGLGYSSTADSAAVSERDIDDPGADIVIHHFNWRTSRFDFEAFKSAIMQILVARAPAGEVESSPYPRYSTPDEVARTLVALVEGLNRLPREFLLAHAQQRDVGSAFHAFAQSARDLKTGEDK
jgi:hypothetical protein